MEQGGPRSSKLKIDLMFPHLLTDVQKTSLKDLGDNYESAYVTSPTISNQESVRPLMLNNASN